MLFGNCIGGVPFADDPELVDALNDIIDEYGIDFVYPAHDSALLTLTKEQEKLHARVVTSDVETVEICRSKARTYKYLADDWYLPKVYDKVSPVDSYPVFAKPDVGQGAEGVRVVYDACDLADVLQSEREYVVCEYLPGDEYTVDCFTDKDGALRYLGVRTRERIRSGIAVRSRFVKASDKVQQIAQTLNFRFNFNGAWFFQIKEDVNGNPKLLEVAPRIAGTMGLSRNRGVNMPLLTLYNMLGEDVDIVTNRGELMLDRAFISRFKSDIEYDFVYVDFDDTLMCGDKVNPFLMAFLYQCQNKGKKICVLTRNKNVLSVMIKSGIGTHLFSDFIFVGENKSKADYIHGKAIFIDDSFRERKSVSEKGFPVFDLDAVESLFDWSA